MNHSWEFHQIYNFGAVGHKDELIRFWVQTVKVTANETLWEALSHMSPECMDVFE